MYVKQTCSRTIQTSSADRFVRGAHHRRCAREGLTWLMMPYAQCKLQAHCAVGGAAQVSKSFIGLVCQVMQGRNDPEGKGGNEGCRGDCENPGPDDAAGYAPFDSR
jgi:hypothetical protein